MKKFLRSIVTGIIIISLSGCATVQDVQRGTDIIRTDNELARLLQGKQVDPVIEIPDELIQIGDHARKEGNELKNKTGKALDAISYYRIASTAYWKSKSTDVTNHLFDTVNSGIEICNSMGDNAPDRDCLYLQFVIPLAALESIANEGQINKLLEDVDFSDGSATTEEIQIMDNIANLLEKIKPLVENILDRGADERLLSHSGINTYYCKNAEIAVRFFNNRVAGYIRKANLFKESFTDPNPKLKMSVEQAQKLSIPKFQLPFCVKR
jgi:hypothetical protein